MNTFDFSIYDETDDMPVVKKNKPKQEVKKEAFDFDKYDYNDESQSDENIESNMPSGDAPWYEKFGKALSFQAQIAPQPKSLPIIGKAALSGASAGFSEGIDALKLSDEEKAQYPELISASESGGAFLPIGKSIGLAEKATKFLPKSALQKLLQTFTAGSIYEGAKQGAKAVKGEETDLTEIPITGAGFVAADALLRGGGFLAKKFLDRFGKPIYDAILETGLIPKDLPKSQYEAAEQMLNEIRTQQSTSKRFPLDDLPPPPSGSSPARLNANRITGGEDLGLRPTPRRQTPNLKDQVGDIFSQNRFYNTTQGGQAFRNEIMNLDEDVYRGVNELYNNSRQLNSNVNEIHPQLVNRLRTRIQDLEAIPEPSDVQRRVIRASNNIIDRLAQIGENGEVTGYQNMNNQVLIDQIQSLRQIIDYDFAHGDTKNIFRPLINDLQDAAIRAAENSATPQAAEALNEARTAYRTWVEAFDNDYVRPFRNASNQDNSKLFKSALDLDESNMLRNILQISPRGQELLNASTREIVEKHLGKFFENPSQYTSREFANSLRELEAVITPQQAQQIRDRFSEASRPLDIKAVERTPQKRQTLNEKYQGKKPEDIMNLMDSRSGIKQVREDFPKESFERLSKQKMRSVMRGGNIESDVTGDQLYKFLNKEKNYELFSEFLGETETENLRQAAKEIGNTKLKEEARKKTMKNITNKVMVYKTISTLLGIF